MNQNYTIRLEEKKDYKVVEKISAYEYVAFLKRTGLGSQYPKERFAADVRSALPKMKRNAPTLKSSRILLRL